MSTITNLNHAVWQYLETKRTDYAIMINGEWGSGKTYYLKNNLFKDLNKSKPELKCIYLSLFGVTGSSDLNRKFFLEVYPHLNNKWVKTAGAIGKSVLSNFGVGIGKDEEDAIIKFVTEFNDNTLIVFDDLERLDKDLLIEILGFINQMVEHNNIKVIISVNENEILEGIDKDSSDYDRYTEKLVRHKLHFKLSFNEIGNEIITGSGVDQKYQEHVLEAFNKGDNRNLRTLQFASALSSNLLKSLAKAKGVYQPTKDKIAGLSIKFLCTLSIESKAGRLEYIDMKKLSSWSMDKPIDFFDIDFSKVEFKKDGNTKSLTNKDSNVQQVYFDKYFLPNSLMYFDSVVEYLNSGYWDEEKFNNEVKAVSAYLTTRGVSESSHFLDLLVNFERVEDQALEEIIVKVMAFVGTGEYQIDKYLRIFNIIRSLITAKLYSYKIKQLYKEICNGIDACKDKNETYYIEEFVTIRDNDDDFVKEIYKKTIRRNQKIRAARLLKISTIHFEDLMADPNGYMQKYLTNKDEFIPCFHFAASPKRFLEVYNALPNASKCDLNSVFFQRQKSSVQMDKSEMDWMRKIKNRLNTEISKRKPTISILSKKKLVYIIDKVIESWTPMEDQLDQ